MAEKIRTDKEIKEVLDIRIKNTLYDLNEGKISLDDALEHINEQTLIAGKKFDEIALPIIKDIIDDKINEFEKTGNYTEIYHVEDIYTENFNNYIDPNEDKNKKLLESFEYHNTALYREEKAKIIEREQSFDIKGENIFELFHNQGYDNSDILSSLYADAGFDTLLNIAINEFGDKKWEEGEFNLTDLKIISNILSENLGIEKSYTDIEIEKDKKLIELSNNVSKKEVEREY